MKKVSDYQRHVEECKVLLREAKDARSETDASEPG
jgi:hypothetical protein